MKRARQKLAEQIPLILKAQKGDKEALHILVEDNLPFIRWCIPYWLGKRREEHLGEATIGFIYAVHSFDTTKGIRPTTYFKKCIYSRMLSWKRRDQWQVEKCRTLNDFERIAAHINGKVLHNTVESPLSVEVIKKVITVLSEREQMIFWMKVKGIGVAYIADYFGISKQRVFQILNNLKSKLRRYLNSEKLRSQLLSEPEPQPEPSEPRPTPSEPSEPSEPDQPRNV